MTDPDAITEALPDYWSGVTDLEELRAEVRRFRDEHNRVCRDLYQLWMAATEQRDLPPDAVIMTPPPDQDPADFVALRMATIRQQSAEAVNALQEVLRAQEALHTDARVRANRLSMEYDRARTTLLAAQSELRDKRGYEEELTRLRAFLDREFPRAGAAVAGDETAVDCAIRLLTLAKYAVTTTVQLTVNHIIQPVLASLRANGLVLFEEDTTPDGDDTNPQLEGTGE